MKRKYKSSVSMAVIDTKEMSLHEHLAITSFTHGVANESQYDKLLRMMNVLLIAGQTCKTRKYAIEYVEKVIKPTLISVKSRFIKTGKFGVSAHELESLREMLEFSRQFWIRQTLELWSFANEQVDLFYAELSNAK